MNRKKRTQNPLLMGRGLTRILCPFILIIFYLCGSMLAAPITYAAGDPAGNVSDPVVKAVDIAKPAVVRIMTTLTAHLTVNFPTNTGGTTAVRFPQTGQPYRMDLSGTGAFITAHGDILTADHVVNPPRDQTDPTLYQLAAQDVANYFNSHSTSFVTPNEMFNALSDGSLPSQSQYDKPSSAAYLSTDYTGPVNATTLAGVAQNSYASVQKILQESNFDNGEDTAIVHVNMDDTPSIKLGDASGVAQQDTLTIIGFPGNGDLLTNTATTITDAINPSNGFFTASVNKLYVSALKQNGTRDPLIQVGGNVEEGDSGGPALDENGNIVGIVSFFLNANGAPEGTSFLQTNSTAQQMISSLQLDTTPGTFQTAWNQAFNDYSSSQAGHWHTSAQEMQKLASNYPNFRAVQPFLNYANTQASKETTTVLTSSGSIPWLVGAVLVLVVIFVLVLLLFLARRKKSSQVASATQPASYQSPSYNGSGTWPESPELANSGTMAQVGFKDEADENVGSISDRQLAQPNPIQSMPQVSQTPAASYNAARSGPLPATPNQSPMSPWPMQGSQTPTTPYNAAQLGSHSAMPNHQPPTSPPWPQTYGAGAYGQPAPYGQQPYNTGQPTRPVQGGAYPPYPAQQGQYGPYQQASATPWPPLAGNTPYAPPYAAQQEEATQRRQPFSTSGVGYGLPPQGYGAMPAPAQAQPTPMRQQQVPPHLIPDASPMFEDATVRANQRSTATPEEISGSMEVKKDAASPMAGLSKDQTETVASEQDAIKRLGEF